jgi:hypothetical protein
VKRVVLNALCEKQLQPLRLALAPSATPSGIAFGEVDPPEDMETSSIAFAPQNFRKSSLLPRRARETNYRQ